MADGLLGYPTQRNLNFFGTVTKIISPTVFICSSLAGQGDNFFQDWSVWLVRKGTGTGYAPQGDKVDCASYLSNTGQFTLERSFDTAPVVEGDQVYLLVPFLTNNTNIVDEPSSDLKQSSDTEVSTSALTPGALVKSLAFTGSVGSCRVMFDLKVDNPAGIAYAVIYKNGSQVITNPGAPAPDLPYTLYGNATTVYQTFSQDISGLVTGDLVQVYAYVNNVLRTASVANFRIYYDIVHLPSIQAAMESVYFDSTNGVSGTVWPIGGIGEPVNNALDALAIMKARGQNTINMLHGVFTVPNNLSGIKFIGNNYWSRGVGDYSENMIELSGYRLTGCSFDGVNIDNHYLVDGIVANINQGQLLSCGEFKNCTIHAWKIYDCHNFENCDLTFGGMGSIGMWNSNYFTNCIIQTLAVEGSGDFTSDIVACKHFRDCEINVEWLDSAGTSSPAFYDYTEDFVNCLITIGYAMQYCKNFISCRIKMVNDIVGFVGIFGSYNFKNCTMVRPTGITWRGVADISASVCDFSFNGAPLTLYAVGAVGTWPSTLNISGDFTLTIDNSCVAGIINVYGHVRIINNTGGTVVNDYTIYSAIAAVAALIPVLTETGGTVTAATLSDGLEHNIVINNAPGAVFKPLTVKVNLNNMVALDTIVIKVYERMSAAGALELSCEPVTYIGIDGGLAGGKTQITINLDPNRYGFKVTLQQTVIGVGGYKDFVWEYYAEI